MDVQGFWPELLELLCYFKNINFSCQGEFYLKLATVYDKGSFRYFKNSSLQLPKVTAYLKSYL